MDVGGPIKGEMREVGFNLEGNREASSGGEEGRQGKKP